jgi:predicted tellurium resistance membrane protein TerC
MPALLSDPHAWAALAALTALEIVLGIDNVVFISILVAPLPPERGRRARPWRWCSGSPCWWRSSG